MIGRRPTEARDLFDNGSLLSRFHHGVSRIQQLVKIPPPSVAAPPSMCSYESVFFRPQTLSRHSINSEAVNADHAAAVSSSARAADQSDFILTGLDEVSMLVVSFLDGRSLGRMMLVSPAWHAYIMLHHQALFQNLLTREFDTVIPSSTIFKSYLLSLRHELDREIAHSVYVEKTQSALERYCTTIRPENHGFVAMFCDIVRFKDPRIARFVADRRKGAMNMVLTATPQHVQAFRRECPDAGITSFVPIDNPYWPQFELPRVEFPGFLGYAFDHAEVVPGYEALKDTVIKSILKELMLFDTAENSAAYGAAVGKPPFAAIVGATEQAPNYHLTFSNPLREELRHLSITERIEALKQRRMAVDHSLSCRSRRTFTK